VITMVSPRSTSSGNWGRWVLASEGCTSRMVPWLSIGRNPGPHASRHNQSPTQPIPAQTRRHLIACPDAAR
jgi:hypothetical protein